MWYKNLPSQTAQACLAKLQDSWASYFKLLKTSGIKNPQPPKYKRNCIPFYYLKDGFKKFEDDTFRFTISKQLKLYLREKFGIKYNYLFLKIKCFSNLDNIKQIQFKKIDKNRFSVIATYEIKEIESKEENGKYLSIDLGVNNLFTCYNNQGQCFIISGGKFISTVRYFEQQIAYYKGIYDKQQIAKGIKYPKISKRVAYLYKKKNDIINDFIHKATRYIANYCKNNNINTVIIGDITGIRQDNNLGKENNQTFHSLPYAKIYQQLEYKLKLLGVTLYKQNESYSSQCSPNTPDVCKEFAVKANRNPHGLYKDGNFIYNADVVGAYNIIRLYAKENSKQITLPKVMISNPFTVNVYKH
jgi:putative transposase